MRIDNHLRKNIFWLVIHLLKSLCAFDLRISSASDLANPFPFSKYAFIIILILLLQMWQSRPQEPKGLVPIAELINDRMIPFILAPWSSRESYSYLFGNIQWTVWILFIWLLKLLWWSFLNFQLGQILLEFVFSSYRLIVVQALITHSSNSAMTCLPFLWPLWFYCIPYITSRVIVLKGHSLFLSLSDYFPVLTPMERLPSNFKFTNHLLLSFCEPLFRLAFPHARRVKCSVSPCILCRHHHIISAFWIYFLVGWEFCVVVVFCNLTAHKIWELGGPSHNSNPKFIIRETKLGSGKCQ